MKSDNQSVKVGEDVLKELDRLAKLENSESDLLFKEAISGGLKDLKMHLAVKAFAEKKATTSEAADIADVSVGEMMDSESLKKPLLSAGAPWQCPKPLPLT